MLLSAVATTLSSISESALPPATFDALTLVGERWNNGQWARLDADGKTVGPLTLKRGDSGAVLILSPRQSPVLFGLSASEVLCGANDTTFLSSDGGRSWARHPGRDVGLPPPRRKCLKLHSSTNTCSNGL